MIEEILMETDELIEGARKICEFMPDIHLVGVTTEDEEPYIQTAAADFDFPHKTKMEPDRLWTDLNLLREILKEMEPHQKFEFNDRMKDNFDVISPVGNLETKTENIFDAIVATLEDDS